MKSLIVFFALLLAVFNTFAQNDKASVDFIRAVFHEKDIAYTDSISHYTIDEMRHFLNDELKEQSDWVLKLKITKAEKEYINAQLNSSKRFTWKSGLLEGSRFIASDTLDKITTPRDTNGKPRFSMHYQSFYGFGKPIFLRNHSICFFYLEKSCGWLCSSGYFDIYIKRKGVWKRTYIIYVSNS